MTSTGPRPRVSMYARERILKLTRKGATVVQVVEALRREGVITCRQTVWRIQRHIEEYGTVKPLPKSGRPTKLSPTVLQSIENSMQNDDETTAKELVSILRGSGLSVSTTTALKGRRLLGWTRRGTAYCQLIRAPNRAKRLQWALQNLGETCEDVIWSDETSVQMESHRQFHCYKRGSKPRYKPRPKHPTKVHVWAGISFRGATGVCVFDGIMDAQMYTNIWKPTSFLSFGMCIPLDTDSCRIMILSILLVMHNSFSRITLSTGGELPLKALMLNQLKICGMN